MKIRSRILLAAATLLGTVGVAAAPQAHALGTPGDASAVVFITAGGAPGLTNGYKYNSSGGGFAVAQIDSTHYSITFQSLGGGTYVNAQLTVWNGASGPAVDPVCTIDSATDNGTDVTVKFQCTPFPPASLANTSLFIDVTNRTHPDRVGAVGPGFVALTTANPSAAAETPANQYRSSGFGSATVARTAVGQYTVTIPNGAYPWSQGVAFATALTVSPRVDTAYTRYCNPQNWYPSGANMVVNVRCYMGAGSLADARFSLRLSAHNHHGGAQAGGAQWVSTPNSAGYDAAGYGWNSAGGTNRVRSLAAWEGTGVSEVRFTGATYAAGRVPSLLVSAYGGSQRCSLKYHGSNPVDLNTTATVRCYAPLGGAGSATGMYTVSLAQF